MKKFVATCLILSFALSAFPQNQKEKTLFVYGGGYTREFISYTAALTKKERPKICFIPTASADNAGNIINFYDLCSKLNVEPSVMRVWINSPNQQKSWEEIIMNVDAIIVGGGNTLNMLAIWKAQGIDLALKKAYDNGIVLAGGSAGSLCWFNAGTTDSRPKELTIVECLGFLNYSHCPHYHSEAARRPLYHKNILEKKLSSGYACDDKSGILFINGEMIKSVSTDAESFSYFVYENKGEIVEKKLAAEIIK